MGDRTYVTLTVRRADKERTLQICEQASYTPCDEDQGSEDPNFVDMGFDDVNYGTLPFLEESEKAGIPYDSHWERGDEYGPGTKYGRYTDQGELYPVELYESNFLIDIADLADRLHDYNELATFIRKKKAGLEVIDWDNQEHNAKLFRTKQLITQ